MNALDFRNDNPPENTGDPMTFILAIPREVAVVQAAIEALSMDFSFFTHWGYQSASKRDYIK